MKYTMNVKITDPKTPAGMMSEILFNLRVFFDYEPKDYGNGHYVHIEADNFSEQYYDLRYDTSFNKDKKEDWLESWANNYWSGENGAWAVKSVEVTKA
jgi:hypothetical protein